MHVIFKDAASRVVASLPEVALYEIDRWLKPACEGVRCEVYADDGRVRGALITLYVRDDDRAPWRPV
jgi:hypothetical protein